MLAVDLSGEDLTSGGDVNYAHRVRKIIQQERPKHLAASLCRVPLFFFIDRKTLHNGVLKQNEG